MPAAEAGGLVDDGVALAKAAVKKSRQARDQRGEGTGRLRTVRQVATAERDPGPARKVLKLTPRGTRNWRAEAARSRLIGGLKTRGGGLHVITQTAENRAGGDRGRARLALRLWRWRKSLKRSIAEAKTRRGGSRPGGLPVAERTRIRCRGVWPHAAPAAQETAEDGRCEGSSG